ncbi:EEF1A lysine methyltransferase 3 [Picochlorum sp. SENEW3]|nr:EEF1A lysine methyltransferase 3 [Picochlorum sp. SENEW3]
MCMGSEFMTDFSLEFERWTDGERELKHLTHLDRWEVHSAESIVVRLYDLQLTVEQKPRDLSHDKLGVGACVWDGAIILSAYLASQPRHRYIGCKAIELGAGVGLVSLVLGKMGGHVHATELEKLVPLLRTNVEKNGLDRVVPEKGHVDVSPLEWGSADGMKRALDLCDDGYPDLVLASDCCYMDGEGPSPDTVEFVRLCRALCSEKTRLLISLERRSSEVRDIFIEQVLKQFKTVKRINLSKLPKSLNIDHCDLWDISVS